MQCSCCLAKVSKDTDLVDGLGREGGGRDKNQVTKKTSHDLCLEISDAVR